MERYHWLPAHNPRIHSYCRRSEVRATSARLIRRRTEYKHAWEVELRHSTYRECLIAGLPDRHIAKQTSVTERGHKPYPDFYHFLFPHVCPPCEHWVAKFLSIPCFVYVPRPAFLPACHAPKSKPISSKITFPHLQLSFVVFLFLVAVRLLLAPPSLRRIRGRSKRPSQSPTPSSQVSLTGS